MKFRDLKINQVFDFVGPDRTLNSFYKRRAREMMAASLKSIVDGLKRRDARRRTPSPNQQRKPSSRTIASSDYEEGVGAAMESLEDFEKELKKSK